MKQLFADFFSFVQGDNYLHKGTNTALNAKFLFIGQALVFIFLVKVFIGLISISLNKYGLVEPSKGSGDLTTWLSETSNAKLILEVVILAPLFEEIAFRGIIQSDRLLVTLAFTLLCYLLSCVLTTTNFYELSTKTLFISGSSILVGIIFDKFAAQHLIDIISNYKVNIYIIWISTCGFALWHYNNYDFTKAGPQTIVLALLPHFISGLVLSWTSLKYGLIWSIILHIINNAIPASIIIWRAK